MFTKNVYAAAIVALASCASVSADDDCNPTKASCPPVPALGNEKVSCDFTKGSCKQMTPMVGSKIDYSKDGAVFTINKGEMARTLISEKYIFFGRVDVAVQASQGNGIVTSIVLLSDDGDEIDIEWTGNDNKQVQSNYFSKGDHTDSSRGKYHAVDNPFGATHTYSVEWTKDGINWLIDGKPVRSVDAAAAGAAYPQSPSRIKIGNWPVGLPDNSPGNIEWGGGLVDWSKAPFNAYYKSITIVDYAGGNGAATKEVKKYVYGDKSGSRQSIKFEPEGSGNTNGGDSNKPSVSSSSPASSASSASSASKTEDNSKPSQSSSTPSDKTDKPSTMQTTAAPSSSTSGGDSGSDTKTPGATPTTTTAKAAGSRNAMTLGSIAAAVGIIAFSQLI